MMYVRPCIANDIEALEQLAYDSPVGLTSLPEDSARLMARLNCSEKSFAKNVTAPADEEYLFALVESETNRVVGVSGILACSGYHEPYFNFRREKHYTYSQSLKQRHVLERLMLCADNNGKSVFSAFFIHAQYRTGENIALLARARILYMASYPERFCDDVIVEFVGVTNRQSESPFWNSLGKAFFAMEYDQAEHYCGTLSKSFIGELMPPHPIYISLLNDSAQAVIGKHDENFTDLLDITLAEGFELTPYVDLFDAGPCFQCSKSQLRSLKLSSLVVPPKKPHLLCGGEALNYRCVLMGEGIDKSWVPASQQRYLIVEADL